MPFAGYKDFDECVSQNGDKGDPSAYCGSIKDKVEKFFGALEGADGDRVKSVLSQLETIGKTMKEGKMTQQEHDDKAKEIVQHASRFKGAPIEKEKSNVVQDYDSANKVTDILNKAITILEKCPKLSDVEKGVKIQILADTIKNLNPLNKMEEVMSTEKDAKIEKAEVKKDEIVAQPAMMAPMDPLQEIKGMLLKIDQRLTMMEAGGIQKQVDPNQGGLPQQKPQQEEFTEPNINKAEPIKDVKLPMSQEKQEDKTIGPNKVSGAQYLGKEDAAKLVADTVEATIKKMGFVSTEKPTTGTAGIIEHPVEKGAPKEEQLDWRKISAMKYDQVHDKARELMGGVRY